MKLLFDYILAKQPWIVRWMFYISFGCIVTIGASFSLGWKAAPFADAYIDQRISTWAAPKIILRDQQFTSVHERLDDQQSHFDKRLDSQDQKLNILIAR